MSREHLLLSTLWRIWHFRGATEHELDIVLPALLRVLALIAVPVAIYFIGSMPSSFNPLGFILLLLVACLWVVASYYGKLGLRLSLVMVAMVMGVYGFLVLERHTVLFAVYPTLLLVSHLALLIRGFRFAMATTLLLLAGYGALVTYYIPHGPVAERGMIPFTMIVGLLTTQLLLAAVYTTLIDVKSTLTATNERLALKLHTFQNLVKQQRARAITGASVESNGAQSDVVSPTHGNAPNLDACLAAGMELVEWQSLFDRIGRSLKPTLPTAALEFNCVDNINQPKLFLMDASRLSGIVAQLAMDAAEGTDRPKVLLQVDPVNEERVRFAVTVEGRGLSDSCAALIAGGFDEASQGDAPSSIHLLIAGRWIGEMGVECSLTREKDLGYSIALEFDAPAYAPEAVTVPAKESAPIEARRPTIMIVDDDSTIRASLKALMMREFAVNVIACASGMEALSELKNQSVDLIITDYYMPGMDGAQFIRQLRDEHVDTPVLAITTASMGDEQDELWVAGADVVLSKPVTFRSLTHLVYRYIFTY